MIVDEKPEEPAFEDITVEPIYFDFDSELIKSVFQDLLDELVKALIGNEGLLVQITVYTDPVGTVAYNTELAKRRAQSVKSELIKKGVDLDQILVIDSGSPSYQPNDPNLPYYKQRRVVFSFSQN